MFRGSIFSSPPSAPRTRAIDGVPCRPYRAGEHAATISRMLLSRLVAAAVISAAVTVVVPFVLTLLLAGEAPTPASVPEFARWMASPLAFGTVLLAVDWLLVRGRLARSISLVTWAGRRDLQGLRAATGLVRPTDRAGAAHWLGEHREPESESPELLGWRVHLQILVGDYGPAEATIRRLEAAAGESASGESAAWTARIAALRAQLALAQGLPFDAEDLRTQVAAIPDPETRAQLAAEVAALIAQARWTCGGDHLGALAWAIPLVGGRDRGTLLRGYWLPIGGLVLITSLVIGLLFPVSA